ncbi:MAG: CvpA family protein, partial [Chloroflexi bacterium]|nr:CvpA family protein [Chloroflexota bacterium]
LDVIIILVLGVFTYLGLKRGFIKTVIPLLGIVLAVYLAGILHNSLAGSFDFIKSENWADVAAFAIILVGVLLVVYVLAMFLSRFVKMTFLELIDRWGGGIFGFIVGWLLCSVIVVIIARYAALPVDIPDNFTKADLEGPRKFAYTTIDNSALATFQIDTFPVVLGFLPGEFDVVKDFF